MHQFVHCDSTGPIEPTAKDGFKYALSFVDDYTGTNMIYFLKRKVTHWKLPRNSQQILHPTAKLKECEATIEVSSSIKLLRPFYVSMRLDTRAVSRILYTKTARFKEHGEAYLAWQGICCLRKIYQNSYGRMP